MATSKKRNQKRRKKGGRKLEFTIYIAGVLIVCLVVLGIIKGVQAITGALGDDPSSAAGSSAAGSAVDVGVLMDGDSSSPSADAPVSSSASSSSASASAVSSTAASQSTSSVTSSKSSGNGDYITYTKSGKAELSEWYLLLVNPWNSIDSDWVTDMTYVNGTEQLDSRIVSAYEDMVDAAASDGVTIYAISGYRAYSTQQRLYNNRVERAKNENPSFTQQEAETYAATHVARPGTSEHQTGLAIDFNSVETSFGSTAAGQWLKAHAHEYGFILRYEEDKQDKTGVTWEPWHYRFVGVKHATRINQLGYCLEEYVEYIQNGGQ